MIFDNSFIILLPALVIAFFAQLKVKSTFNKYNNYSNKKGYTGIQVARMLLDEEGLYDVPIEIVGGSLTDHYDPANRVMRLSEEVYYGNSIAAIGVAAHETGHAIQHKESYGPLLIRNSIIPIVNFGSNFSWILFFVGLLFSFPALVNIGILLFSAVVLFQIITLPVEFNASSRALNILYNKNILYEDELKGAKSVLSAAAMTYVAAALMAISQLLRLIALSRNDR